MRSCILFFLVLQSFPMIAQKQVKNIDFIICIDEKIAVSSISRFRIIALSKDGSKQIIDADYYPGNLSIYEEDYDKLLEENIKSVFIAFDFWDFSEADQHIVNFEIEIKRGWMENNYCILYVYNTNKKKYRKMFCTEEGKNYALEIEYPGGSVKKIRKK
jgi:hypothetical protein